MQTLDADQEEKSRKGDERTQVRQKSRNGEELKRRGESTGMAEIEKRGREDTGQGEAQKRRRAEGRKRRQKSREGKEQYSRRADSGQNRRTVEHKMCKEDTVKSEEQMRRTGDETGKSENDWFLWDGPAFAENTAGMSQCPCSACRACYREMVLCASKNIAGFLSRTFSPGFACILGHC